MEEITPTADNNKISKDKMECMCPPRKRRYFREFNSMQVDPVNTDNDQNSVSDQSYLARLLNKPSLNQEKTQYSPGFKDSTLKVENIANKNVAWESFLHEIYGKSNSGQPSNKLLSIYVDPSEDPMNYLDREKEPLHSSEPVVVNSNWSSSRSSTSVNSSDCPGVAEPRKDKPYHYPVINKSLTNGLIPANKQEPSPVSASLLSISSEAYDVQKNEKIGDNGSPSHVLDLSVGKKDKSLPHTNVDRKPNGNNDSEKNMAEDLVQDKSKMEEGMLLDILDKDHSQESQHLETFKTPHFGDQVSRRRSAEEAGIQTSTNSKPCICHSSNTDQFTKVNGVSNKVKLTLSSFLHKNSRGVIPTTKAFSSVQTRADHEEHVSLASMAEYFIEVALRKANQEKKIRPINNQEVFKK